MRKLRVLPYVLRILWEADRWSLCVLLTANIAACVLPLVCSRLIAAIVSLFSGGAPDAALIFRTLSLYVGLHLLTQVLSPVQEYVHQRYLDRIGAACDTLLYEKIASFPGIECFEDAVFHNRLVRARDGGGMRFLSVIDMFCAILSGLITITLSACYLIQIQWFIAVIALTALLPGTIYNFWAAYHRQDLYRSQSESSRKLKHYGAPFTDPAYAREMRVLRLGSFVLDKYRTLFNTEFRRINRIRTHQSVIGIVCTFVSGLLGGAALFLYIYRAVTHTADAGSVVLYISLLPQFVNGVRAVINGVVQLKNNSYYVRNFVDFLECEPSPRPIPTHTLSEPIRSICFEGVSFRYPHSGQYALRDVSFHAASPGLIAIVGENGSGKSTLVKLLLSLFTADSGKILVNGHDVCEYDPKSYHARLSAVFQSPARFPFTITENIRIADVTRAITDEEIRAACEAADAAELVEKMPHGYNSVLGKQFSGGVEVSDGQWQKLSLARALCSNADMLIFDEASADLDPRAEFNFYQRIRTYSRNKLTFYITHRLSGTVDADLILVMDQGRLVQAGTHRELMAREGKYRELYSMQASGYESR